jgi:flagellar biosynthesis protein FlhB
VSDDGEKHFAATPTRIAKSKREGNLPRAAELGANLAFAAAVASVVGVTPAIGASAERAIVSAAHGELPLEGACVLVGWALVPAGAAAIAGALAAQLQNGGFAMMPVAFKLERLAPGASLRRMFSFEAVAHAARASGAVGLTLALAVPAMRDLFASALRHAGAPSVAATAWNGSLHLIAAIALLGVFFAFVEFAVARRQWLRKLRMSFEEYKRERKEQDGDPLARSRRRALHRSIARSAIAKVKSAAFVIANPTHLAIALDYRPPAVPVPVVLLRSAEEAALRVREFAGECGIPIVENVRLARALYRDVQVGDPIPHEHYVAVAEVVIALMRSGALGSDQ